MAAAGAVCAVHTALLDFASESFNWQVGNFYCEKVISMADVRFFLDGRLNSAAVDRYLMNFQRIIYIYICIYIHSIHIYTYIKKVMKPD